MRKLTLLHTIPWRTGYRKTSSVAVKVTENETARNRMSGWQIHSYSENIDDLQLSENLKKPYIRKPSELLVKVLASSVNPIDVAMMSKFSSLFSSSIMTVLF